MPQLVSRRRFAEYGLASLAFAATGARAQDAPPASSTVAARDNAANLLTIPVMINDRGPFRFVVDTGADRTVIADTTAATLGLTRNSPVIVEGVIRSLPAETVKLRNMSFGSVSLDGLKVPVLPHEYLRADGYLGIDAVNGYRVTLDFKNHALIVSPPRSMYLAYYHPPGTMYVPVTGHEGHLRAFNCVIDGVRASAFIDTGAEIAVCNPVLFETLAARDPTYVRKDFVSLTGVTGGSLDGRVLTLRRVKLSNLDFDQCDVAVAPLQIFDIWGLNERPALLIGMNWLRLFSSVAIDYGRKELRFDLAWNDVLQSADGRMSPGSVPPRASAG